MKKSMILIGALFCIGIKEVPAIHVVSLNFSNGSGKETHSSSFCKFNVSTAGRHNEICHGANNGSVSASATGGTSPYTYTWSPGGATGSTITGLSAGTYTVNVTDANGCVGADSVIITQPNSLNVTVNIAPSPSCSGDTIANVAAAGNGGSPPYTFSWSGGLGTGATVSGLIPGGYTVTVEDSCGASATRSVRIVHPDTLRAGTIVIDNVSCLGGANGIAKASVSGGASPYTYSWSPDNSTIYTANGLSAGTYTVNIIDKNGCTCTAAVTITQPATHVRDSVSSIAYPACHGGGGSAIIGSTGGLPPYTYIWSPNVSTTSSGSGLVARSYLVEVKDASGCTATLTFTMTQPAGMMIHYSSLPAHMNCSGSAWVRVSAGVPPYTYLWSNGITTDSISHQCNGTYCCTVTGANGCMDSVCVTIPIATGIEDIVSTSGQVYVYPNPNNGQFIIQMPVISGQALVEVYNMLGQKVKSEELKSEHNEINLSIVSPGIYLYRIIKEDGSLLADGKLIIQK